MIMAKPAYICLGSNLGDRRNYIETAVQRLHAHPHLTVDRCSAIYETAPVGLLDQPYFLNMVIAVRTVLPPLDLLRLLLETERELGRVRDIRYGPRTIDLDLLLYEQVEIRTEELELPHPRMLERAFVLVPLMEILELADVPDGPAIQRACEEAEGKEEVRLWEKSNWRSEYGRFVN